MQYNKEYDVAADFPQAEAEQNFKEAGLTVLECTPNGPAGGNPMYVCSGTEQQHAQFAKQHGYA